MQKEKRYRQLSAAVIAGLAVVLLLSVWTPLPGLENLELALYDARAALIPGSKDNSIVLVSIDEESAHRLGSWPWPRSYFAQAITRLHESKASLVGLTLLYADRDPNPGLDEIRDIIRKIETDPTLLKPGQISALLPSLQDHERKSIQQAILSSSLSALKTVVLPLLKDAERRIDGDAALAAALREAQNVVLPVAFVFKGQERAGTVSRDAALEKNSIAVQNAGKFQSALSLTAPLPALSGQAAGLGHLNAIRDRDGAMRGDVPFVAFQDRLYPSFALQMALRVQKQPLQAVQPGVDTLVVAGRTIPLYQHNRVLFRSPTAKDFTVVSFADLIEGKTTEGQLKGKIVLIGHRRTMPFDFLPAQPAGLVPSIDDLAAAVNAYVLGTQVERPRWAPALETAALLLCTFMLLMLRSAPGRTLCIGLIGAAAFWKLLAASLFLTQSVWIRLTEPLLLILAGFLLLIVRSAMSHVHTAGEDHSETFETDQFRVRAGGKSDIGQVRERNEDAFRIDRQTGLLIVADGVGGRESGEVASSMAADLVVECVRNPATLPESDDGSAGDPLTRQLAAAVVAANAHVYETATNNPQLSGMGTTLTCMLIEGSRARIAHVGDTRAYLLRQGILEQVTDDHSVVAEQVRNGLGNGPVTMRNVLTRAIGVMPDVHPDVDELELADGDVLLLCSDGLTNMVPDQEILAIMSETNDPFDASARLVQLANKNGGRDNITAVVAYISKRR